MNRGVRIVGATLIMGVAAVVLVTTAVHALIYAPEPQIPLSGKEAQQAEATVAEQDPALIPEKLSIPALNLTNVVVEQLGVTTGDRMAMPARFDQVAWYKYGPEPGQAGSAVIYGHRDNGLGLNGIFKNLGNIAPGDAVEIQTAGGTTLTFNVTNVTSYPYKAVPDSAVTNAPGDTSKNLVLITCTGHWVKDTQLGWTYDHRLVVSATLAS